MGDLAVTRDFVGSPAIAEALWYDTARWPSWVDGLARLVSLDDGWPAVGSGVQWESHPGGRGRVAERVLAFREGEGQSVEVSDERMRATQTVAFEALEGGVSVRLGLRYELVQAGPLARVTDVLFIRRALTDSLRRTLERFGRELAADRELLR
jgi:Polyketide cyclase / dehydrase and lipid transport